jgi:biotin operon repressor
VSTYRRLLDLLADGGRHSEEELRRITRYVQEWIRELRASGHQVVADGDGYRLVGGVDSKPLPPAV